MQVKNTTLIFNIRSILDLLIFAFIIASNNPYIMIVFFVISLIKYVSIINIEKIDDDDLQTSVTEYIEHLKNKGVFSFANITDQIIGFGSLFYASLLLDDTMLTVILFGIASIIYVELNINAWNKINDKQ